MTVRIFFTSLFLLLSILKAQAQSQLFWGLSNGEISICPEERILAIQAESYEKGYTILDWKMTIENQVKMGTGFYLSEEISPWIYEFQKDSLNIIIRVNYQNNATKVLSSIQNTFFFANPIYKSDLTKPYSGFIIIDKNEDNYTSLFDPFNTTSFMGMILQNPIPEPGFMSDQIVTDIHSKNPEASLIKAYGYRSTPLASNNRDSNGRIVDSLEKVADEYYSFYPDPHEYYYDLTDISRLILLLDTVENRITKEKYIGISRVGLAKKYSKSDKYVIVITFNYSAFAEMPDYNFLLKADSFMTQKLTDKNSYFQNEFKELSLKTDSTDIRSLEKTHEFFPYFESFSYPQYLFGVKADLVYHLIGKTNNNITHLDNGLVYSSQNRSYFDSFSYILGAQSDVPLTNWLGDPLYIELFPGITIYVYPIPDTIVTWVETDSIQVFTDYKMRLNDKLEPSFQASTIYFVKQFGSAKIPFLALFISDGKCWWNPNYLKLDLKDLEDQQHFKKEFLVCELEFLSVIARALNEKPRILRAQNKTDLSYLFSEFNLERTGNLLNLELK